MLARRWAPVAKICLQSAARADINAACVAVAQRRNEKSGAELLGKLMDSVQMLAQFPLLGATLPGELGLLGYRRLLIADRFWCYYVIADDAVVVHRVLHKGSGIPLLP